MTLRSIYPAVVRHILCKQDHCKALICGLLLCLPLELGVPAEQTELVSVSENKDELIVPLFSNHTEGGIKPMQRIFSFFLIHLFLLQMKKQCDQKLLLRMKTECVPCSLNLETRCPAGYTKITNGTGIPDCRYPFCLCFLP